MNRRKNAAPFRMFFLFALLALAGGLPRPATAQNVTVSGILRPPSTGAYPVAVSNGATFTFTFDFCRTDQPDHFTRTVKPADDGSYSFTDIPKGKYNVYLKAAEWLRTVQTLDASAGSASPYTLNFNDDFVLLGDSNQDNSCDSTDFTAMIGGFNSDITMPGSGYDPAGDFNYDGFIDSSDFTDLIGNFSQVGAVFATNLTITQQNLAPRLQWDSVPNKQPIIEVPVTFRMYRAASPNATNAVRIASDLTTATYNDTSIPDRTGRTTYYYRVTAVDIGGQESLPSNEFAFKIRSVMNDVPAPGWAAVVPMDGGGGGAGPSASDSVNLSSGVYENHPGPDLVVRNPNGPDAMYERSYYAGRAAAGYHSPGLPIGWTDNYDLVIGFDANGLLSLRYPNGAADALAASGGNNFAAPAGAPYLVTGTPDLTPMNMGGWTQFTATYSDLSKMVFTPDPANKTNKTNNFLLTEIDNLLGQKIMIKRDMTGRVTAVTDGVNNLLTITPTGATTIAQDVPGNRSVQYTLGIDPNAPGTTELLGVSKIAFGAGNGYTPQYTYHYTPQNNWTLMSGVTVPNPGDSTQTQTTSNAISYADGGIVSSIKDANGNTRNYAIADGSATVTIPDADPINPTPETWTETFTGNTQTGDTDAQGNSDAVGYGPVPYLPTDFTNKNGQKSRMTYDTTHGNYGSVQTTTTPITYGSPAVNGVLTTNYTYAYDVSPLGLLTQIDQIAPDTASRTLAKIGYYPTGQVKTIQTPQPGADGLFVTTTYTYTPLGHVKTVTAPGPNGNVTYTFGYGVPEALGEPTSVSDPLGHITSYTYDGRGNVTSVTLPPIGNAAGYRTDYTYNDADQLTQVTYPATGQTSPLPGGRAATVYTYFYVGGPLKSVQIYNEGDTSTTQAGR